MYSKIYPIIAGLAVLITGVFISTAWKLYDIYPQFDKLMHFSGGLVTAWFFYAWFRKDFAKISKTETAVVLAGLTAIVGIVWEAAELLSALYGPAWLVRFLYIGTLPDTLVDLFMDMLGALIFYAIALRSESNTVQSLNPQES